MTQTREIAFETVIETHLLDNGYVAVGRSGFDPERAIFPETLLAFLCEAQPAEWARLEALLGARRWARRSIIPYQDSDLERLYVFLRHLGAKLPRRKGGPAYQFDDDVRLEYYRLQKIGEGSIDLRDGYAQRLDGPSEVGSGQVREQPIRLSRLIDIMNEQFGTSFTQADQLFFDQILEVALGDETLKQAAAVNPADRFELVFRGLLETLFVERMDQNEEIFIRFMNEKPFQKVVTTWLASEAYRKLRAEPQRP